MTALHPHGLHAHLWRTASALGMIPLLGPPTPVSASGNHPAILVDYDAGLRVLDQGPPPWLPGAGAAPAWPPGAMRTSAPAACSPFLYRCGAGVYRAFTGAGVMLAAWLMFLLSPGSSCSWRRCSA